MASFEERSNSSKVDSSDAETNENCCENLRYSRLNGENCAFSVNIPSELMLSNHSSTMENVIVQNRIQLQSASDDTHSDTSSGQIDCTSNTDHGNFEAENIVSSTQETTNDSFNGKLISDSSHNLVNKCDVIDDTKSQLPKSMANEKHLHSEQSHVAVTASELSSQNRKVMDESKRHLHISDLSKAKSKSSESGSYCCRCCYCCCFFISPSLQFYLMFIFQLQTVPRCAAVKRKRKRTVNEIGRKTGKGIETEIEIKINRIGIKAIRHQNRRPTTLKRQIQHQTEKLLAMYLSMKSIVSTPIKICMTKQQNRRKLSNVNRRVLQAHQSLLHRCINPIKLN